MLQEQLKQEELTILMSQRDMVPRGAEALGRSQETHPVISGDEEWIQVTGLEEWEVLEQEDDKLTHTS